jgi:GT2 family glycosyltransferase
MTVTAPDVAPNDLSTPSVLALVVVGDGSVGSLRECLLSLAHQSYPRVGVLAIDDATTDGSSDLLQQALGPRRVLRNDRPLGLAGSVREALSRPVARRADFVLLVDPEATLDPDTVGRLVEAAIGIGVEQVGIVGAKIVDHERPRLLRDIGRSSDRFGHPYSALQPGEIDQGQFDRVLEVLCVSPAAMLIARDAWERIGLFDERLDATHADLDLCWRARVAGYRVLMTPLARVRLRQGIEQPGATDGRRGPRYAEDRAAIATMLKNYGLLSLLWVLPLSLALGVLRFAFLALGRRFDEAYDLAAAWGWNVSHLPGTFSRRRRAQKSRRVSDRSLHRFMASAGLRLPRWFATAERILEEQRAIDEADEGEPIRRKLRDRTASLVGSHPVIVGSFVALVVGAVAARDLVGIPHLVGGALPSFPPTTGAFFTELTSSVRFTPLGGPLAPSPALAGLGVLSWIAFGDPGLVQKAILLAGPGLAAILLYRSAIRLSARPGPAVLAAAAYALSALAMWAFSEGRLGLLIAMAVLPAAAERIEAAFASYEPVDGPFRAIAGLAVTVAIGIAAFPGILLPVAVLVAIRLIAGPARARGTFVVVLAMVGSAVLLFPFLPTLVAGGGRALSSFVGTMDAGRLARLALGPGPGTWAVASFVPVAAVLGLGLVRGPLRAVAGRAAFAAAAGLILSWLAVAGYVPAGLSDPPAYAALAAVSMAWLIALGLTSFMGSFRRDAFGLRQVTGVALVAVLGFGLFLQSIAGMVGTWGVGGPERIPPAWAVVGGGPPEAYRVLWLAGAGGTALPPPAGDPRTRLDLGTGTVRASITDRSGASILDIGRPLAGPGADRLERIVVAILDGDTRHGGALLSSFGVRFVVGEDGVLPSRVEHRLDRQLDLDLVPATGLTIYRNAAAIPPAAVLETSSGDRSILGSTDLGDAVRWRSTPATPLERVAGGWDGPSAAGTVFLSTEFDPAWELVGSGERPRPAFGWATSFSSDGGPVRVRHGGALPATIQLWVLGVLWLSALWITRKPVAR